MGQSSKIAQMKKPLLSIVIPTKNRYKYLKNLLSALVAETTQEFEIVIQDNSDDNRSFEHYIVDLDDDRVRYNHTAGWLSVIDNCDLGLERARGEYVCMLGDDDGIILESSILLVEYMKKHDIHAANVNKISYTWPDTQHAVWKDALSGTIRHQPFTYDITTLDAQSELEIVLRQGGAFGLGSMPRVYHAFVSKAILDMLKEETGTYFPGPSPDMANAVGLTRFIDKYIYASIPTVISGHCIKSTGGAGGQKKHHGKIENIAHLPKDTGERWGSKIPYFWSGPTIYAESARRALEATGRVDSLNYRNLYAVCLIYERQYANQVLEVIKTNSRYSSLLKTISLLPRLFAIVLRRGSNFMSNRKSYSAKNESVVKANSIAESIRICQELLGDSKWEMTQTKEVIGR